MTELSKIYLWPDGLWEWDHEIDDLDLYISTNGKSDDFAMYEVPAELSDEDITELIELSSLPGMIPDKIAGIEDQGKVQLPDDAIIVIDFPPEEIPFITSVTGKMIINTKTATLEILKGK